ncbi:MAG: hypothetical protein D6738_11900 [Acidobacteria bacterium]|nr:MAG: hypothetical protein D6738_11900 [Acidobacteriota bacterium]
MRRLTILTAFALAGVAGASASASEDGPALAVGRPMPAFTLPAAGGGSVSLESLLEHGPVVIVIYRGVW